MLINIPIEPLHERYSGQWAEWVTQEFEKWGVEHFTVTGLSVPNEIEDGSFLDVVNTNIYKLSQMESICNMIRNKEIVDGAVFFFHDLWFPSLEVLAYIRDGLGLKIKVYGCLHAGTYDPYDFLHKKGMAKWGEKLEESWFQFVDKIFVATEFHKTMIIDYREVDEDKIVVTGFPIYPENIWRRKDKQDQVVFPHRLDQEKNPQEFDKLAKDFPNITFVRTMDNYTTKEAYYDTLAESAIAVSFADQETWGIAMQEALFNDCIVFVPDRLSYKEMYPRELRYDTSSDLFDMIHSSFNESKQRARYRDYCEIAKVKLRIKGRNAIPNMLQRMNLI